LYDFPDDDRCRDEEIEYMFGLKVLVVPIIHKGSRACQVYLPAGAEWKNDWTGEVFPGETSILTDAPL